MALCCALLLLLGFSKLNAHTYGVQTKSPRSSFAMVCGRITLAKKTVSIARHVHRINHLKAFIARTMIASFPSTIDRSSSVRLHCSFKSKRCVTPVFFIPLSLDFVFFEPTCQCWHHKPMRARITVQRATLFEDTSLCLLTGPSRYASRESFHSTFDTQLSAV